MPAQLTRLALQHRAEVVYDFLGKRAVLRIEYRYGERGRWTRFYLVPEDGESFTEVASHVVPAIEAHARERRRVTHHSLSISSQESPNT